MPDQTLAIDFGTSNSAAALLIDGVLHHIPVEAGAKTVPTAVFFPTGQDRMLIGHAATGALINGDDGRYMRALKSVLGQPLLHEARLIGGRQRTISDVITDFLSALKDRAETATGLKFSHAFSGRPVHFHTAAPEKDAQAEEDLRNCYLAAGFTEVQFMAEPEAAAFASHTMGDNTHIGMIVDIGGGTSDFSVFRNTDHGPEILASHGIRLGGTNFDTELSVAKVMPELGLGGQMRRDMGPGLLSVPRAPYIELATWAKIPFLYTGATRRMVADMVRTAVEPQKIRRLASVLEHELGHELALAVETGKIAANSQDTAAHIDLGVIEPDLQVDLTSRDLNHILAANRTDIGLAASQTLHDAGLGSADIGRIILVGGASLMGFVTQEMRALCPDAALHRSDAFTAVIDGLAIAARHMD